MKLVVAKKGKNAVRINKFFEFVFSFSCLHYLCIRSGGETYFSNAYDANYRINFWTILFCN